MKKILVVVDYQNDFVDGALGFEKAVTLEKGICCKVQQYLNNGHKVLFTYDTHNEDYLQTREGKNLPVPHCIEGTSGHDLYGKLNEYKDAENTIHINKHSFGMSPYNIEEVKKQIGSSIDEIEITGVVTNMCVISNAVALQSQYVNAEIIVDAALCAGFDESLHEKALDVMSAMQIKVINR